VADKDPLSAVTKVEQSLKGVNRELDKAITKLSKINGLAGQSYSGIKNVITTGIGSGSSLNLGTSGASFGTGSMPFMYSAKGAGVVGAAQVGLGVAGGLYSGMPDMNLVMARAGGYYNVAQRGFGTTRAGVAAATFSALRGGVTGLGEDVAASNVLTMGYNYNPGGASYLRAMREVGGAALQYNMPNATAAQAIGSMHTGAMGANLYQYGISTIDVKTGTTRSFEDIAKQLYQKQVGNRKFTQGQLEFSMREGFINQDFQAMGFSQSQQELLRQAYVNFSQGKGFNLETMTGEGNPLAGAMKINASQTALAERATEPYVAGLNTAADALVKVNSALALLPDSIYKTKGALDAFSSTNGGSAVKSLITGVGAGVTTALTYQGLKSFLGKTAVKTATGTAAKSLGLKTIAKVGLKAVPYVGTALLGYDLLKNMFGTPANAVTTNSTPAPLKGNQTETSWATSLLSKIGAPITEQNISAMTTWMAFEGGGGGKATGIGKNSAMYNPLNTTQGAPGAISMNSVGVKSYNSWDQGMDATVQTLMNGKYSGILSALQQGNNTAAVLSAVNASPWGTNIKGYPASNPSGSGQTVNITLTIDKASDAEAIAFAKKVKTILQNDKSLATMGSK
jgi:hypothetical protein